MRCEPGMKMMDFDYQTPWARKNFYQEALGRKTALLFLRYYGCSTCQLNIRKYVMEYPKLQAAGINLLIVLQSQPETIREQAPEDYFPFDIICDPDQGLYRKLEIGDNPHPDEHSEALTAAIAEARANGIQHGKFEGNEAQSPATFLLDKEGTVIYSWYGVESIDVLNTEQILEKLQ